jgi:hypothetical protein
MEATTSSVGAHGFVVGTDGARATRPLFGRSGRPVPGGRGRDVPARASIAAAGARSSRGGGRGIAKTVIGAGARARCGRVASRSPELAPLPPRMDELEDGRRRASRRPRSPRARRSSGVSRSENAIRLRADGDDDADDDCRRARVLSEGRRRRSSVFHLFSSLPEARGAIDLTPSVPIHVFLTFFALRDPERIPSRAIGNLVTYSPAPRGAPARARRRTWGRKRPKRRIR